MISGKIEVNVLEKQIPSGLIRLAGTFERSDAVDKAEGIFISAGGNPLNGFVYSRVRAKSQCIQIQSTLVMRFRLLKFSKILEGFGKPEVGVSIIRVNL